jgi:hypothetical protein
MKRINNYGINRRSAMKMMIAGSTAGLAGLLLGPLTRAETGTSGSFSPDSDKGAVPGLKITKIRYYAAPGYTKPLFNQARVSWK